MCTRCQGNGEIVKDWNKYLCENDDENAVAECPDCDGEGHINVQPEK